MNLPAHIITCHTIHEPTRSWHSISRSKQSIIVSQITHQEARNNSVSAWPGPLAARRNCSRPPGGIHFLPGASVLPDPLFPRHRLAELTMPPGASQCRSSLAKAIAWRLSVDRQAPHQNNTFMVYDTPVNPVYHLNPFHRSHKNPNLNPHIGEPTIIVCKQIHVPQLDFWLHTHSYGPIRTPPCG